MRATLLRAGRCFTFAALLLFGANAYSQFSTIEVGEATLPAAAAPASFAQTPFTRINFAAPFAPGVTPNVFTMTPEFGAGADDDPCLIRIRNISNTGFDATCLEPRNEDRATPGTTFEYIAILNGTVDIPTSGGGNVRFESQCPFVNRQVSGPACSNCVNTPGIPTGYQRINFINNFNAAPALLTELVTTNNTLQGGAGVPGGEPEFLGAAVRNLNANRFDVSVDRLEAGNGSLFSGESICYLAVERQGCQTLDLSGISGSISTVNFEAVFGGNVDGHDNGNTSGEGASFESGCFVSTPVGVADMRTRNGNNGGFIRRANINASEVILTIDEDRVSDAERSHIDESVSALVFGQTFTTPVTLSRVKIQQFGRRVKFAWQTTAESFHLGFHLWGETNNGWEQLNRRLIPGQGIDTESKANYSERLRLTRQQYNQIQRFGISSVDTGGFEEFYGPFEAGQEYGEEDTSEAIDWTATRENFERNMTKRGYVKVGTRWRRNSKRLQSAIDRYNRRVASTAVDVTFEGSGVRKVPVSSLLQKQPRWRGVALKHLAVTLNGEGVARYIDSQDAYLSDDDVLIFNAVAPQAADALYLQNYNYRLVLDRSRAVAARSFDGTDVDGLELITSTYTEHVLTRGQRYSAAITSGDPWYDTELLTTGTAVNVSYTADVSQQLLSGQAAKLKVSLFGSIDLPEDVPDHHVQIWVNGELVDDHRFDGLVEYANTISLPAGLIQPGPNEVSVTLPGDTGLFADLVLVDELTLLTPVAIESVTAVGFLAQPGVDGYRLAVNGGALETVFASSETGGFSLVNALNDDGVMRFASLPFLSSDNKPDQLRYTVVDIANVEGPSSIESASVVQQHRQPANLLVVAHPNFIGTELLDYIEFKRQKGYVVQLLDWLQVVESYGHGNNTPDALNNFLRRAQEFYQPENMLIVGGHTYDYLDVLGSGSVNFIPTHYRRVGIFEYAPADNVFADLDNDNRPELAVGRWPVRSEADLTAIIAKSKIWQAKRESRNHQNALLIAQSNDGRNLNFEQPMDGRVASPLRALSQFQEPTKVYLQQLQGSSPIQQARESISQAINSGTDLVSFAGHASTSGWGFQGIVNTNLIKSLQNYDEPTIVMPLACYTTNYQSLSVNTLAHQWMFAGKQGAVAVHGAAMLGEYRENSILASRILDQAKTAETLGQAIKQAKRKMAPVNQMLHNWTLLGDPTLPLH